jgi:type II secretory pathway pseudopilin PulG
MKIIPTKAQWKKWGLPSKASYVGCALGVLGILLAIVLTIFTNFTHVQISNKLTEKTLSNSEIKASAILQDVKANSVSISIVNNQIPNASDNVPAPLFKLYQTKVPKKAKG